MAEPYILPRYIRYVRALALVSGATVGIAAGAASITTAGCQTCNGTPCPGQMLPPPPSADASADATADLANDKSSSAAGDAADGAGDDGGGGPRPAPLLPRGWIA